MFTHLVLKYNLYPPYKTMNYEVSVSAPTSLPKAHDSDHHVVLEKVGYRERRHYQSQRNPSAFRAGLRKHVHPWKKMKKRFPIRPNQAP